MLAGLAGGRADGSWESRLRRLARVDLLIIDDFAMRAFTASQGDDFYELMSERAVSAELFKEEQERITREFEERRRLLSSQHSEGSRREPAERTDPTAKVEQCARWALPGGRLPRRRTSGLPHPCTFE